MGKQISFYLDDELAVNRLMQNAKSECRRPNDHARYIILKSLGLVTDDGPTVKTNTHCDAKTLAERNVTAGVGINP